MSQSESYVTLRGGPAGCAEAWQAYEDHTGGPLDPSLIKPEEAATVQLILGHYTSQDAKEVGLTRNIDAFIDGGCLERIERYRLAFRPLP